MTYRALSMWFVSVLAVLLVVPQTSIAAPATAPAGSPPGCRWRYEPGRHLALATARGVVWQLNFRREEGGPYFHPLCTPGGTLLTWHQPSDHPWHHALWFSWKYINGLNYWNEDPQTGRLQGLSDLVRLEVVRRDEHGATVRMRLNYRAAKGPTVLQEVRTLVIGAPDAEEGDYRIDWHQRFAAGRTRDAVLDRTPPKEQPWGGYAGLSYRAAQSMSDAEVSDSEGRRNLQCHGQRARWVDASGRFGGGGSVAGVAIFAHPSNPRHPTPWHVVYEPKPGHPFIYTNPALLRNEPLTLPAGRSLELYYRVLVHQGPSDAKRLDGEFRRFAATKPPSVAGDD